MRKPNQHRPRLEALEERALPSTLVMEVEPNNTKATANVFSFPPDNAVELQGKSVSHDDRDFFKFTAAQSGTLQINVQTTDAFFAKMTLEDRAGNKLFENQPRDGINSGSADLVAGQTYFIRMRSPNKQAAGYLMDLNLSAAAPAPSTPSSSGGQHGGKGHGDKGDNHQDDNGQDNNEHGQAAVITLDAAGTATLTGTVQNQKDRKLFQLTAPKDGTLSINLTMPNGGFAKLEVESANGSDLLEIDPRDGTSTGSLHVVAGQTYFVQVRARGNSPVDFHVGLALT